MASQPARCAHLTYQDRIHHVDRLLPHVRQHMRVKIARDRRRGCPSISDLRQPSSARASSRAAAWRTCAADRGSECRQARTSSGCSSQRSRCPPSIGCPLRVQEKNPLSSQADPAIQHSAGSDILPARCCHNGLGLHVPRSRFSGSAR
jgi:hypothetical protein